MTDPDRGVWSYWLADNWGRSFDPARWDVHADYSCMLAVSRLTDLDQFDLLADSQVYLGPFLWYQIWFMTFPERCYGPDVWYPKCDVMVPHVLPQSRTLVRPPNPYLPLFLTLGGEGRGGSVRPRDHRVRTSASRRKKSISRRRYK